MKTFEEQFTAWVDDKMTPDERAEFEKHLDEHPEALADRDDARKLGRLLREHPTAPPLAHADFFNHQLLRQIEAEMPTPTPAPKRKSAYFWSIPGLAFAGACCLAFAVLLARLTITSAAPEQKSHYFAQVVEAWPQAPNVTASTVYDPQDNVTVLWLDGLDYIPASNDAK